MSHIYKNRVYSLRDHHQNIRHHINTKFPLSFYLIQEGSSWYIRFTELQNKKYKNSDNVGI